MFIVMYFVKHLSWDVPKASEVKTIGSMVLMSEFLQVTTLVTKTGAVTEILRFILKTQIHPSLCKPVMFYFISDDLQEAKKLLAKMKYFANLEDKLKAKKIPSWCCLFSY